MTTGRSRRYRRNTARMLADGGDTCAWCWHLGAESGDHIIPIAHGGTDDIENLAPIHFNPCPVCGQRCNQARGTRPFPTLSPRSRAW